MGDSNETEIRDLRYRFKLAKSEIEGLLNELNSSSKMNIDDVKRNVNRIKKALLGNVKSGEENRTLG